MGSKNQIAAVRKVQVDSSRFTLEGVHLRNEECVRVEVKLFHFDHNILSKDAVYQIYEQEWQLGTIDHFLPFAAKYPKEQRRYSIVVLGAVPDTTQGRIDTGKKLVPYFYWGGRGQQLELQHWDVHWTASFRFLAARKIDRSLAA